MAEDHSEHERAGSSSESLITQVEGWGAEDEIQGTSRLQVSNFWKLLFPLYCATANFIAERAIWVHVFSMGSTGAQTMNAIILLANKGSANKSFKNLLSQILSSLAAKTSIHQGSVTPSGFDLPF